MDIHRLINEVQRRPALWDTSHPDHSNRVETKRLWESVAFVLGLRIDVCRSKWKNLRCSYRRLQKQQQSPATASPAPQWPYMKAMSFLESNHDDSIVTPKAEPTDAEMELEADNDLLMQEFQSMATPQAMRRLSHNISLASAAAEEQATSAGGATTGMQQRTPPTPQQGGISALAAAAASSCQCAKRVDEQVNFLQSLEREEQQLMQSTSQDLARCKNVLHVGDSDYNFLISFLPLMKQMSPLQNVSFRAKMGDLLLQTMQQPLQLQAQHHLHHHPHPQPPPPSMPQSMPQPMMQQQQQQQQAQPADQQQQQQQQKMQPKQEPQASQMLLNQQQMALDQAQQVSTSSTSWN